MYRLFPICGQQLYTGCIGWVHQFSLLQDRRPQPRSGCHRLNTLRPRQDGLHFPDDIFKWIFFNEIVWISTKISLKFVPRGPINNITALVQIMTWRGSGEKPWPEPMMVSLLTHICVTRSQWVNTHIWYFVLLTLWPKQDIVQHVLSYCLGFRWPPVTTPVYSTSAVKPTLIYRLIK